MQSAPTTINPGGNGDVVTLPAREAIRVARVRRKSESEPFIKFSGGCRRDRKTQLFIFTLPHLGDARHSRARMRFWLQDSFNLHLHRLYAHSSGITLRKNSAISGTLPPTRSVAGATNPGVCLRSIAPNKCTSGDTRPCVFQNQQRLVSMRSTSRREGRLLNARRISRDPRRHEDHH